MALKNGLLLLCCAVGLTSCHSGGPEAAKETLEIEMPEVSREIYLPNKIWDAVTGADFEKAVHQGSSLIFAPIAVRMEETSEGVLNKPKMVLKFPKGGGEVDFSKYIKSERGTFHLFFDIEGLAEAEDVKIFYVSKARRRKLDGEIFGSDCGKFYNIKSFLLKKNSKEGLVVNVTRDRQDSALGGHFVFGYKKDKQNFISQVTFSDSKRPDLFCEELRK